MAVNKSSSMPFSYSVTINLMDLLQELIETKDISQPPKNKKYYSVFYHLEERIEKLKYVQIVCLDHQAWVELELDTDNHYLAHKRVAAAKIKIENTMRRWAKQLPDLPSSDGLA